MTDVLTSDRQAKARRMEKAIRGYFDACNTGDADAVAAYFAPGAVHYFPPDMYSGPFRGGVVRHHQGNQPRCRSGSGRRPSRNTRAHRRVPAPSAT